MTTEHGARPPPSWSSCAAQTVRLIGVVVTRGRPAGYRDVEPQRHPANPLPGSGWSSQAETSRWRAISQSGLTSNLAIHRTRVTTRNDGSRVVISCLLSDIVREWMLEPDHVGCVMRLRDELEAKLPRLVTAAERA
jgi:hypothetical protein